jgi:hypothetical protein
MDFVGTAHGNRIELDTCLPLSDGTRVRVSVRPENGRRPGSPAAVLRLIGTLTTQEAEHLLLASRELRKIDPGLWADPA